MRVSTEVVIAAVICVAVFSVGWYGNTHPPVKVSAFEPVDYTGWQTYHNATIGLTFKYPPNYKIDYSIEEFEVAHPEVDLKTMSGEIVSIVSKKSGDKSGVEVTVEKQPLAVGAPIFTNIQDLYLSDIDYLLTRKHSPQNELVSLNGYEAIYTQGVNKEGEAADGGSYEQYYLIRKDRLIAIGVVTGGPFNEGMLQSITFNQ